MPVAFASMKLMETQRNWSTIVGDAHADLLALCKYRNWIFGSGVTVHSDHNPLLYLTESAPKSAKLMRWSFSLAEFEVTFKYCAGKSNVAADYLSRLKLDDWTELKMTYIYMNIVCSYIWCHVLLFSLFGKMCCTVVISHMTLYVQLTFWGVNTPVTRYVDYRVVLMGWMHCTCRSTNTFRCIFWGREVMSRHVTLFRPLAYCVVYRRASTCLSPSFCWCGVCWLACSVECSLRPQCLFSSWS